MSLEVVAGSASNHSLVTHLGHLGSRKSLTSFVVLADRLIFLVSASSHAKERHGDTNKWAPHNIRTLHGEYLHGDHVACTNIPSLHSNGLRSMIQDVSFPFPYGTSILPYRVLVARKCE